MNQKISYSINISELRTICTYQVDFIIGVNKKWHYISKSNRINVLTTQCLIFKDGLLIGQGQCDKYHKDSHNGIFAMKLCLKRAIIAIKYKPFRGMIWSKILPSFESAYTCEHSLHVLGINSDLIP